MKAVVTDCIKVLVVDDSAIVRKVLSERLDQFSDIKVVGTAPDPFVARDKIVALRPHVLTLDIEMPRMDGVTFLQRLMQVYPMPVVVLSSLTTRGSQTAVDALAAGAVEVVAKPGTSYSIHEACDDLATKIRQAACMRPVRTASSPVRTRQTTVSLSMSETTHKIIAIGASTGGVQALTSVLTAFPIDAPGTVVVQHMPAHFTCSFAERLNRECAVTVKEAQDGDWVRPGQVLLAPGGKHMTLRRSGANYLVRVQAGQPVCHQMPSVDVLFESVADYAGANAVGAILTGMGADGAEGLLAMRQSGARTVAQDEASCVVFGMPKEAIAKDAVERVASLANIPEILLHWIGN